MWSVRHGTDFPLAAVTLLRYNARMKKGVSFNSFLLALLRIGMGLFFLYTAVMKVGDLGETAQFLTRSRLLPEAFSMPLACLGLSMEFVVGICLLLRFRYKGASLWGVVMTSVFLVLYAQAWARGLELSCNCMGSSHEIVNYPLDTGVRMLLLGAMLLLFWDACYREQMDQETRRLDFSEL